MLMRSQILVFDDDDDDDISCCEQPAGISATRISVEQSGLTRSSLLKTLCGICDHSVTKATQPGAAAKKRSPAIAQSDGKF